MIRLHYILFYSVISVLSVTTFASGLNKVWVYSDFAVLRKGTEGTSEAVDQLKAGTELTVITKKQRWLQVATNTGQTGWIYKGKVSERPIANQSDESIDNLSDIILVEKTTSAIDAEEVYTARSIRGTRSDVPTDTIANTPNKTSDLSHRTKSYATIRDIQIELQQRLQGFLAPPPTDQTIEDFLKEGHIGEYASENQFLNKVTTNISK